MNIFEDLLIAANEINHEVYFQFVDGDDGKQILDLQEDVDISVRPI